MLLISKYNKRIRVLLCVIDVYSKYDWVVSLKDGKRVTITNHFSNGLDASKGHKAYVPGWKNNKIWVHEGTKL